MAGEKKLETGPGFVFPNHLTTGSSLANNLLGGIPGGVPVLPSLQKQVKRALPADKRAALRAKFLKELDLILNNSAHASVSKELKDWLEINLNDPINKIFQEVASAIIKHTDLGKGWRGSNESFNFALDLMKFYHSFTNIFVTTYGECLDEWMETTQGLYQRLDALNGYDPTAVALRENQLNQQLETAKTDAQKKQDEVNRLLAELGTASGKTETSQKEIVRLSSELSAASSQLQTKNSDYTRIQSELDRLQVEAAKASAKDVLIATLTAQLDAAKERNEDLKKQLTEANARAAKYEDEASKANEAIRNSLDIVTEYKSRLKGGKQADQSVVDLDTSGIGSSSAVKQSRNGDSRLPAPRDVQPVRHATPASGARSSQTTPMTHFKAPAPVEVSALKKSQLEQGNSLKITETLNKLRSGGRVSDCRLSTLELLARFISYFTAIDLKLTDQAIEGTQLTPECMAVSDAFIKMCTQSPSNPKPILDAIVVEITQVNCSESGRALFEALKTDLLALQRRSVRQCDEQLNHVDVLGQFQNLTVPTRFNMTAANIEIVKLRDAALAQRDQSKSTEKAHSNLPLSESQGDNHQEESPGLF